MVFSSVSLLAQGVKGDLSVFVAGFQWRAVLVEMQNKEIYTKKGMVN